jgi:serine/threonine protein kinase
MIPNSPPSPRDGDETAVSGAGLSSTPPPAASNELTDASGPTDVTVVRAAPSATTINDKKGAAPDANNFGKYELLGEIARGGMGIVYRARQHGLDRLVALKMVLGTGTDHEAAQRFLQEARAAAALDHPNVVPIYDTGEINGRPYFTMALIDGPNLRGYADGRGTLPIPEVVGLFAQVVEGVAHAHKHGIIHRDLKPANVLMDKDGRPRVTDFGLAKRTAVDSALTATGQVVGTPQYMAPEQARDSKDVGPPADVYSLGAILYFLLTGRPPFSGESFTDLLIKVVTDPPTPPRQARADVPADLEALCLRCLAKQPAERFADASELADALVPIVMQYHSSSANRSSPGARIGTARPAGASSGQGPGGLSEVSGPAFVNAMSASVPASPAAAQTESGSGTPNRKPLVFGLAALVVVLVAVAGFLATRDKKPDVAKNDPPHETAPAPHTPGTTDPNPGTPNPPVNDADKSTWPAPSQADFGLKFELAAVGMAKDKDGVIPVTAGTPLILKVTPERDCRVTVWLIEPDGDYVQVFPNEYDTDNHVKAGQTRVIGETKSELDASATKGAYDRLFVRATVGDAPVYPPGTKVKQYTAYTTKRDQELLVVAVRGIIIKKAGAPGVPSAASDAELRFRAK